MNSRTHSALAIRKPATLVLAALTALLATGCHRASSAGVASSDMQVTFRVTGASAADTLSCHARFTQGGYLGTYLELSGGDQVSCSDGTTHLQMTQVDDGFNQLAYVAVGLHASPGAVYTVTFKRASGETYTAVVDLPEPITISAPLAGSNHVKGAPLTLTWNAAGAANPGPYDGVTPVLSWKSGDASSDNLIQTQPDNGSFIFSADATKTISGSKTVTGTVQAQIVLTRLLAGTQPAISGTTTGERSQTVSFNLTDQ